MSPLAGLLPPGIWAAQIEDRGQAVILPPDEEALVARAGEKRRRDFVLGRACARAALAQAGLLAHPVIARAEDGRPIWPAGFCGSITHTRGYAAALAARTQDFGGVGVDAERVGGIADDLWPRLFNPNERQALAALEGARRPVRAALLFSAKEACFKASGTMRVLAFQSIHIEVQGDRLIARQPGLDDLQGCFAAHGDLVLTAFWRRQISPNSSLGAASA